MKRLVFFLVLFLAFCPLFGFERIVSLVPSGTEILFALGEGDHMVGRTDFCNYPAEASEVHSVGGFDGKSFSLEHIVALNPDFVYLSDGMHNHLLQPLNDLGIKTYLSTATSIDAVFDEILEVAKLTDKTSEGKKLVKSMKKDLKKIQKSVDEDEVIKIYWEVWNAPFMSCGKNSFINDIITYAGGKNIFGDIDNPYPTVSEESIIASNPDIILAPGYSKEMVDAIYSRNGWKEISAIKDEKVFSVDGDLFSRPGPRVIDAVKFLADILNEE